MGVLDDQQVKPIQALHIVAEFLWRALSSSRYGSQISCLERVLLTLEKGAQMLPAELQEAEDLILRTLCTLPQVVLLDLEKKAIREGANAPVIVEYLNKGKKSKRLWNALLKTGELEGDHEKVNDIKMYNVLFFNPVKLKDLSGSVSILQELASAGVDLLPHVDVVAASGLGGVVALLVAAEVPLEKIATVIPQLMSFFYVGNLFPRSQRSCWSKASIRALSLLSSLGLSSSLLLEQLPKKILIMAELSQDAPLRNTTHIFENFTEQGGKTTLQEALVTLLSFREEPFHFKIFFVVTLALIQKYLEVKLCNTYSLFLGVQYCTKRFFSRRQPTVTCFESTSSVISLLLGQQALHIDVSKSSGRRKFLVWEPGRSFCDSWESGVSWVKNHMLSG